MHIKSLQFLFCNPLPFSHTVISRIYVKRILIFLFLSAIYPRKKERKNFFFCSISLLQPRKAVPPPVGGKKHQFSFFLFQPTTFGFAKKKKEKEKSIPSVSYFHWVTFWQQQQLDSFGFWFQWVMLDSRSIFRTFQCRKWSVVLEKKMCVSIFNIFLPDVICELQKNHLDSRRWKKMERKYSDSHKIGGGEKNFLVFGPLSSCSPKVQMEIKTRFYSGLQFPASLLSWVYIFLKKDG